ncbi:magnesium/cobalt transporter CorA [Nocardioides solisilvae]|uniref:magnesium/cobalt transporter CorA n=1 Tax=Nocardioides solisilvae TaxID=1542435 RepID=UPI000D741ACD|nr:magnesium/cobalt transporter CorA [Nocardioides solisilvae]
MIVDNAVYREGRRVPHDLEVHDILGVGATRRPGDFQWVGLHEPDPREMQEVAEAFGLHPLAVEDAVNAHQRPKLELYDDMLFLVLKTLWYVDAEDAVETGEIGVFVGRDYVVTVRHGEGAELQASRRELEARAKVLAHGPTAVLYAVCDKVVDDYESVGAELEIDVDEVEASVFAEGRASGSQHSARIYTLKREAAEVRRAVLPLREPLRLLASGMVPGLPEDTTHYFRDVHDHLTRVGEVVDTLDTLLASAFESYVARISMQQNEDMRKISAGAALVVVPTLVAGVYGMNFDHMPELGWRYGYPFALALMVAVAGGLLAWFKRSGWL